MVDTLLTSFAPPKTISEIQESDFNRTPGGLPHSIGLLDTLASARELGMPVAKQASIVGVESVDCHIIGVKMRPVIAESIPFRRGHGDRETLDNEELHF